jgi:hypothetical protein
MVNVTCSLFPLSNLDKGLPGSYFNKMNRTPVNTGWELSLEGIKTAVI